MTTPGINVEENVHAENMFTASQSQASDLIERAIAHSAELLKKANLQADQLINQANIQAEQLIIAANLNEKKLLQKADSTEINLLKKADSSEHNLIKQANSAQKDLKKDAALLAKDVSTSDGGNAKQLVKDADVKAKALLNTAATQAKELISEADDEAQDLVAEADEHARDLVKEASLQAKDLVKVAAFQARDLVSEAADQTKDLVKEAATQAKEMITEAAKVYIENKMKFLNTAAHELRTPITSINFALELAEKQDTQSAPVSISYLKYIRAPLDRLSRLLSYLIDMSRMERKFVIIEPMKTNFVSLIEDCLEEFRLQNPNFQFKFSKPYGDVEINLDPVRIHQVLSNLTENAVKYCGTNVIEISLQILPNSARVEVRDHGVGISKELEPRLFSPFQRGASDSSVTTSGLGLGLSLCQEIIKLHKGSIGLAHTEGEGCTFYFELPLHVKAT